MKTTSRDFAETKLGRLRVLHVIPRLGLGGTEKGVLKVIRGLGEDGFAHQICAVRGIDEEFAKQESIQPPPYSADSSRNGFQFPLFRLKRIMQEFRPHIVHSRNFGALEAIPLRALPEYLSPYTANMVTNLKFCVDCRPGGGFFTAVSMEWPTRYLR